MFANKKSNSIQAVDLFVDKNSGIVTRIFYAISFIFTTAAFFFYVYRSYEKWKIEPDIAVRQNQIFVSEIPFPAVTICSPVFARSEILAYKNYSSTNIAIHPEVLDNLNSTIANYLIANQHACNPYYVAVSEKIEKLRTERNIVKLLNESFLNVDEVLSTCAFGSRLINCKQIFNRVLTDRGFCYSFNMQGFNTIFNSDVISEDFNSYKRTKINKSPKYKYSSEGFVDDDNETIDWTLDKGFNEGHHIDFFPVSAKKGETFLVFLYLDKSNFENTCGIFTSVFNYYLHLPNEMPSQLHRKQFVRFHEKTYVSLTATVYKTHKDLQKLEPDARGCYFEGERKLKYFKSYTKNNCNLECIANFTLKNCGCLKFSMPRDKDIPVCDFDKSKCYYSAMNVWPGYNLTTKESVGSCGCLNTCNDIKYRIAIEEGSRTELKEHPILMDKGITEEDIFAYLKFTFDETFIVEEESYAPYALQNFIADTGGLLGLFIGCSLLSFFELFYFISMKISQAFNKGKKLESLQKVAHENFHVNVIKVRPIGKEQINVLKENDVCTKEELQKYRQQNDLQIYELKNLLKKRDKELACILNQMFSQYRE
ncbi:hypothetical protein PVAND_010013 [Polypedilum vanderplanki]|uniref:Uncharacterized protein n=1 Tax=Polypedilum vanderplanki TaxID=319348 RepID=A0A9J6CEH3_POLVA|nr:hypothetical protein PVAND_010013 [Polypedilum vanderplanki]